MSKYDKKYRFFMLSTRLIIGLVIVFFSWNTIISVTFYMHQGPDILHAYDMGNNYEIWSPPNNVHHWKSRKNFETVVLDDIVKEFTLVDSWLIGKTEGGWFAINKETHSVYYPISSSELKDITGFDVSSLEFLTLADISHSGPVVYPHTKKAVANVKKFLIAFPFLLAFIPNIWGFLIRRKIKTPKGAKQ